MEQRGDSGTDIFVLLLCYRPYVSGLGKRAEDDTPAQALDVDLVAVGHHTGVVGAADTEAGVVLVCQVHRRTKGTLACVEIEIIVLELSFVICLFVRMGRVLTVLAYTLYRCKPLRVQILGQVDWLTTEDVSLPGRGRVIHPTRWVYSRSTLEECRIGVVPICLTYMG